MNITFYYHNDGAIGLYRAYNPASMLKKYHNINLYELKELNKPRTIAGNDIVVLKSVPNSLLMSRSFYEECKYQKCKLYIDIDDDYFQVPESNIAFKFYQDKQYMEILTIYLQKADKLIVSTEYLKRKFEKYNKNVVILPNMVNLEWFKENIYHKQVRPKNKIRVAWGGAGVCHRDEFDLLKKLLQIKDIEVDLLGIDPQDLNDFAIDWDNVNIFGWMPLEQYYRFLWHRNYDLMYAPLLDTEFNRSKSDIKILECFASCKDCGALTQGYAYKDYKYNNVGIDYALEHLDELKAETKVYSTNRLLSEEIVKKAFLC